MPRSALLSELLSDETAGTAIEYGLILALIFLAMVGAVYNFAGQVQSTWSHISTQVQSANQANSGS